MAAGSRAGAVAVGGPPKVDRITQEIKNRRDHIKLLEKNRDFKQGQVKQQVQKALEQKQKGDTHGALMSMKRKKKYEKDMETISNQISKIEAGIDALEAQVRNAEVLKALEGTTKTLQAQQVTAEETDKVLEDMQEGIDRVQEVEMAFNQSTFGEQYDEDELLEELAAEEGAQVKAAEKVVEPQLPSVPTAVPGHTKKISAPVEEAEEETEEERELRELERSLNAL